MPICDLQSSKMHFFARIKLRKKNLGNRSAPLSRKDILLFTFAVTIVVLKVIGNGGS